MPAAPLHALTAPAAGTGKSLLVDAISLVTTGRFVPVISQGKTEEELEKRLSACLLAGDQLISIDNCSDVLKSSFLCQSLTQPLLNIRLLGHSRNIETPNNALMFANGNNLGVGDDLCRRTLLGEMDAHLEHPELRHFDVCLADDIRERRPALVAAILTILRAWHVSNTRIGIDPLGSFESWSRRIREPLIWLDCDDQVETVAAVRGTDPKREALAALLVEWDSALGTGEFTVQQIIDRAITLANAYEPAPAFHNALLTIADKRGSSRVVCPKRLGLYLHDNAGKIVTGRALKGAGIIAGYHYWRLAEAA
jgi:putative DNA primase/helicase